MSEEHPQRPVNPYGMSKLAAERAMADYGRAYGLGTVALRYFNAAGCDAEGELGERHDPETHLVPLVLREALRVRSGGNPADTRLQVFGDDFDTPCGAGTKFSDTTIPRCSEEFRRMFMKAIST